MKKLLRVWFICILLLNILVFTTYPQTRVRKNVNFPDIPGYKTLKCDFHMHTFLSDGHVSPEYRVAEAWADGLDVIAITDHLDRKPRIKYDKRGKEELFKQAYSTAKKSGIVLCPGAELTRSMPPGHYNLLFIKKFGSIKNGHYIKVLKQGKKQSAFIQWNHPGWKQKELIPVWYKEQTKIYKKGLMTGMEIINGDEYYPLAFQWALEKNLTVTGNSDIHDSTKNEYNEIKAQHRPMTLLFAKDTTLQSIKEALTDRRTVVYYMNLLLGNENYLLSLFHASVEIPNKYISINKNIQVEQVSLSIVNHSCFDFRMKLAEVVKDLGLPDEMVLKANSNNEFTIRVRSDALSGDKDHKCFYKVTNLFKSANENLLIEIPLHLRIF